MKLFNVVIQFDLYVVAHDEAEAKEAGLLQVRGDEPITDVAVYEVQDRRDIREDWNDQRPIVSNAVTDDEYADHIGSSTIQIYERFYEKE